MEFFHLTRLGFKPIFVVGAPRSGTTILHSLLCTAKNSNAYIAECSLFTGICRAFFQAANVNTWKDHTKFYFKDEVNRFSAYASSSIKKTLFDIWVEVKFPRVLVLKDPMLSSLTPFVMGLIPEAVFVVSVRNPLDVVASRVNVWVKEGVLSKGDLVPESFITRACNEYVNSYAPIIKTRAEGRIIYFSYNDIINQSKLEKISSALGLLGVNKESVWSEAVVDLESMQRESAWSSDLYGEKPTLQSVDKFKQTLSEENVNQIEERCMAVYQNMLNKTEN